MMCASTNEKGPQKVRFFDWLVDQIDSGAYEGLRWLDKNRTTFRVPWKHSSRKNLVEDDYRIFQAWAAVGGKYEEGSSNPSRWKTNFRNALKSTNKFKLLSAVQDPHPHHVYRINMAPEAVPPVDPNNGSDPDDDPLPINPHNEGLPALPQPAPRPQEIEVTFGSLSLGNLGPAQNENAPENCYPCAADTLKWIIQQANLKQNKIQQVSWGPVQVGDTDNLLVAHEQVYCQTVPHVDQNSCLQLANGVLNQPVENSFYEPMSIPNVNSQSSPTLLLQYIQQNAIPGQDQLNVGAGNYHLDVSIYYRGKLLHETEVTVNSCMFTYNKHHHCDPTFGNTQIIQFPNPKELPDQKQVRNTLILLQATGLLLYEKDHKICARRLDKCKVYWAFSKQLDNITQHSQFKCLQRNEETVIFDYVQFWQELKDFHEHRRSTSPDYTIYLCFGQCFSAAKSKESKLILVKLVPKYCKEYHEFVLREGASSLSSDMSLHISNSLMDMIEQYLTTEQHLMDM
ncbi:interferon regulatory factor 7 isoform X2 [Paroedura picta]|uniref:interferon regulatory factor 7 isoform X2 n=1 Tax=Paroedura picta TaxID=143630 RepID=UPI004056408B